jgi:hypothetical protein
LGKHVGDLDNIAHTAYKAGGKPISTTFSDLRRRRGSRPAALVCNAIERVASKGLLPQAPPSRHREEGDQHRTCCPRDGRGYLCSSQQADRHSPARRVPYIGCNRPPSRRTLSPSLPVPSTVSPPYLGETYTSSSPTFFPVFPPAGFFS